MKPIKQANNLGCCVACIAFVLKISYREALKLFRDGERRVNEKANFYFPEIVNILKTRGTNYEHHYLKKRFRNKIYREKTIVFIKRTKKYRYGHYLCRYNNKWMDPWINLPNKLIKAGFRKRLPGKPIYAAILNSATGIRSNSTSDYILR